MTETTDDDAIPPARQLEELRRGIVATQYQFDPCCQDAFDLVYEAWSGYEDSGGLGEPAQGEVAAALDHGPVAPALVDLVLNISEEGSEQLDRFATAVIEGTSPGSAGARFVRALNAETDGRVLDAEADLAAALAEDPNYGPAIYELARFASDRGDISRAIALYRRAGPATRQEVEFLIDLLPDHSKVGRNDPCPCGSGRKFKQCHQDKPEVPADKAALWLFQKVLGYLQRPQFGPIMTSLAEAAADGAMSTIETPDVDDEEWEAWSARNDAEYGRFRAEPFLMDLAVFEAGVIERFAVDRAALLPPAETEMLRAWIATDRRLWEVTDVEPGRSIDLRDTATGDLVQVAERAASESLRAGDAVVARIVPVHDERQLIGQPVSIMPRHRDSAVQLVDEGGEAEEWAEWFGRMLAPETS